MKRFGGLFPQVVSFENLHDAFKKAAQGKRDQPEVIRYQYNLEGNLLALREHLLAGGYRFGPYHAFDIFDPKPRLIVAAPFENRVVHHAMCNVMTPIFEKTFITDSYACREGKGTHAAVLRLQQFMRDCPDGYVLQCDIRKYFPSISHATLKTLIERKIKDPQLLALVNAVIDSSPVEAGRGPGMGLPIGNLTSQLFANIYLDPFDHFVKQDLHGNRYVRYVDDFVLICDDKSRLFEIKAILKAFLSTNLGLDLHPDKCHVIPVPAGITFLGYRVWTTRRRVKTATMVRLRRREKKLREAFWRGLVTAEEYARTMSSSLGHIKWGDEKGVVKAQLFS